MSRYSKKPLISDQTRDDAMKVARATQKAGQTKEQTRLIAQGIQKGIDHYKKQQKSKARELDKKLKNIASNAGDSATLQEGATDTVYKSCRLPWFLLLLSWAGFVSYLILVEQGLWS
ncbi:MAG: DUF2956 domain-containing protein [Gammaproteobacteria bacterium]|nr:DUF2956 domain-containing protein [Gammaproteobacteria bacterium]MBL6998548.1 DUF2956 domain-containing protein [Gammaproteobacteria bacterium]